METVDTNNDELDKCGKVSLSPISIPSSADAIACSPPQISPIGTPSSVGNHGNLQDDPYIFQSPVAVSKASTPGGSSVRKFGHPIFMSSPSPAPKMPGNGAKNELYLKSVLSSPYPQRSYTPMSATPSGLSPAFRTPLRSNKNSPSHICTPQRSLVPNPFENGMFDHLDGPMFMSPGVFTTYSTPSTDEKKPFRWSIEHLAELNPVNIEEMPRQQAAHMIPDKDAEARAQKAIEKYFASHLIAPSPFSCEPKKKEVSTPDSDERLPKSCIEADLQGSIQKQLPQKSRQTLQDASCQTVLSLPVDFNINALLAQYLINQPSNDEANVDFLSTSSLRRKLFFQGETSSAAPSPVKGGYSEREREITDIGASPQVSPVKQLPEGWNQATPLKTPSRNQFSSSPIKNIQAVVTPNSSPLVTDFLESPELSPIIYGHHNHISRTRSCRSSGVFIPHDGSLVEDLDRDSLGFAAVSPIVPKFEIKTHDGSPPRLESPGMSPIQSGSLPCDGTADGSFLQEKFGFTSEDSDSDLSTPVASSLKKEKRKTVSSRKISHLSRHRHRNITADFGSDMEFESVPIAKNLRFADDIKTSSLLISKDLSYIEMDSTQENTAAPNSTAQDTGYCTTSLQSTNQDTGLHTNLTTQFSSLPLSTTNPDISDSAPINLLDGYLGDQNSRTDVLPDDVLPEDSAMVSGSYLDMDMSKPLVKKLLDLTNPDNFEQELQSENQILERARQALSVANTLLQNSSLLEYGSSQKNGLHILHELEPIVNYGIDRRKDMEYESASEKALAILRKAGEDLNKYGNVVH